MRRQKKTVRNYTYVSTVKEYLACLASHGEKTAFRYWTNDRGTEEARVTYAEFERGIHSLAAALTHLGLVGKRLAIIGDTSVAWISTYLAGMASGCVVIPMDRELSEEEIPAFIERSGAAAVLYSRHFNELFDKWIGSHPTLSHYFPLDPDCPSLGRAQVTSFADVLREGEKDPDYAYPDDLDPDALAEMLFTSGTTGTSKCVRLSIRNVLSAANSACETVEFFPDDTIVSVLPLHHTYELSCMLAALDYGMTIGINDSIKHALRAFSYYQPTGLVLVPLFVETIYKKIWDGARRKGQEKKLRSAIRLSRVLRFFGIDIRRRLFREVIEPFGGRLTKIVSGGARLSPEIVRGMDDFGICVMEGYGITECSPLISVNPYYARKLQSVGPAVPCCTVRVDDPTPDERGRLVGEIVVKGTNVMLGYDQNDEANQNAFTADGWFRTGDLGYMDRENYIFLTGRQKSVIVLENGKNVFPEELEEYLSRIPGVLEAVVVGREEPDGHVDLVAIVVPDPKALPDLSPDELQARIRSSVDAQNKKQPSFKHIHEVEFRETEFEKTTSRKIKRHLIH